MAGVRGLRLGFSVFVYCWSVIASSAEMNQGLALRVAQDEAKIAGITDGAEKLIVWAGESNVKTDYSIVYLHGYSASRQETHPLTENIAKQLDANVFYTRFTGHGRDGAAMATITKQALLNDTSDALDIGHQLGEKVIVIGVSTGATLATLYAAQGRSDISAMILISPNFKERSPLIKLMRLPYVIPITKFIFGDNYSWEPKNALHDKYWTHTFPLESMLPMLQLLEDISRVDLSLIKVPLAIFYSPDDKVINVTAVDEYFIRFGSANKELVAVDTKGMLHSHVIAGDILAPYLTDSIVTKSLEFIEEVGGH
ncbi:MAG: alpha-beta hydrolase superfamily lysophospholipase [Pseudomonadales bacterium]|jgi:alpha-beta hydrolase superfamily lysophospholipase